MTTKDRLFFCKKCFLAFMAGKDAVTMDTMRTTITSAWQVGRNYKCCHCAGQVSLITEDKTPNRYKMLYRMANEGVPSGV